MCVKNLMGLYCREQPGNVTVYSGLKYLKTHHPHTTARDVTPCAFRSDTVLVGRPPPVRRFVINKKNKKIKNNIFLGIRAFEQKENTVGLSKGR